MNALTLLVLVCGYLAFCGAFWLGERLWLAGQDARVRSAANVSAVADACAVADDLARSGAVVLRWPLGALPSCPSADGWQSWVVWRVS